MPDQPIIFWFRRNLRIADNPALHAAARTGAPVIPFYVLEENAGSAPGAAACGGCRAVWPLWMATSESGVRGSSCEKVNSAER